MSNRTPVPENVRPAPAPLLIDGFHKRFSFQPTTANLVRHPTLKVTFTSANRSTTKARQIGSANGTEPEAETATATATATLPLLLPPLPIRKITPHKYFGG